ncbi:MAG: hypothetical protein GY862_08280 [Gammaproteobacteria bacterium]|nr:hypothetical protein [Gammaproteobacteria bacterium]
MPVSSSPAEDPDCDPVQGCFKLRLKNSSPMNGVFTVPIVFTALKTGTAEVCFTTNNRFQLNGSAVLYSTPGCISVPVCPALGAAAMDADETLMDTAATAFNACMTINGERVSFAEIPIGREVQINGMISADLVVRPISSAPCYGNLKCSYLVTVMNP